LRPWLECLAVTTAFLAAVAAFELLVGGKRLAAAAPLATPVLAATSAGTASVVTSLLFVGVHLLFWLLHRGASDAVAADAVGVFLFSLLACWLYARSSSAWPPTFAHVANNLLAGLLRG